MVSDPQRGAVVGEAQLKSGHDNFVLSTCSLKKLHSTPTEIPKQL